MNEAITTPSNQALGSLDASAIPVDNTIIGLSFSGGSKRVAAFSSGVLEVLADHNHKEGKAVHPVVEQVDFVSGVLGSFITAA